MGGAGAGKTTGRHPLGSPGVPKAHGVLHAKLALEGSQRRGRVEGPVAPRGAREAILKNMPMMAIMVKRPLASSARSFLASSAGSLEVITFQPYSPGFPVLCSPTPKVPSTMSAKKTICTQPMVGTLSRSTRPPVPSRGRAPWRWRPSRWGHPRTSSLRRSRGSPGTCP